MNKHRATFIGLAVFALGLSHGNARAEDWSEFRGPTGQGHVAGGTLPTEWGLSKNLAWRQEIPGLGWSSPIIVQGRVYLTTGVPVGAGNGYSLRALCLDAATGQIRWNQEVIREAASAAPRIHTKNSHASPTPVWHDGRLYVHFGHRGTACLDANGNILWKNTDIRYAPVHGNGGSPVVVDGLLVFSCDGGDIHFVVALDCKSGKEIWRTHRNTEVEKKFSFNTPLVIEVHGQKQLVSAGSNAVCAYEPRTGKEIWRVRYDGYSVVPRPVAGHGMLFICTGYDSPKLLAIRVDGQGDVTDTHIAWQLTRAVPHTPSLLLVGEELYSVADNGVATCLDARSGKRHWQERLPGKYSASPIYAGGNVYYQNEEGLGTVLKAGKMFAPVARNDLHERSLASFAAADSALFIRTESHLYRFEQRWLELFADQKLDAWANPSPDWISARDAQLDPNNPRLLQAKTGKGAFVNGPKGRIRNLVTKDKYRDVEIHVEFLIPRGSNSGVKFEGLYEIQIRDTSNEKKLTGDSCGGIYPRAEEKPKYHHVDDGVPPRTNACLPAGQWQTLDAIFVAPRFDEKGIKTSNARLVRAVLNGKLIHENVELKTPTGAAWVRKEIPEGPLLLQADHGPVAFRNVRVRTYQQAP